MVEEGDSKAVVAYMDQNKVVEEVQEVVKKHEAVAVDLVDGGDEGVREEEVQHSKAEVVGVHHIRGVVVVQKDLVVVGVVQKGLGAVGRAGAYGTPLIGRI
ncbi:hypothetical protein ERO13_D12G054950v2 [Gossypium hirsutum]|uniref:Uncharacterized protein n=2 Tax=Gossypium TaxID=3633 RepID=A0A5J5NXI9_GOSBA|nr:hypothetical protein ES319_D12G059600v1 [Gossypium barbadense]KAG4114595.1 hypothetical protein ERO13_D12G054950v2 [Gossypium hirsutum]TYG40044.1 hypothetical protein ES288_D12G062000v1 [Gossypium darwinii]